MQTENNPIVLAEQNSVQELSAEPTSVVALCPGCFSAELIKESRCNYCPICGWSACSV